MFGLWSVSRSRSNPAMSEKIVTSGEMVTLLGGGRIAPDDIALARGLAPVAVAADGGAAHALAAGWMPRAVIGDFDSISDEVRAAIPADRLHVIAEQESTDFDKCLRSISAPLVLGLGFLGTRLDHELAALGALSRPGRPPCILMGGHDIAFLCPPGLDLDLPQGTRVSLFPLGPVTGRSTGLEWPIDGIDFAADGRVGTSNRVSGPVRLEIDAPRMLAILPRDALEAAIRALVPGGHG